MNCRCSLTLSACQWDPNDRRVISEKSKRPLINFSALSGNPVDLNSATGVLTRIPTNSSIVELSCAVGSPAKPRDGNRNITKTAKYIRNLLENIILLPNLKKDS